MARQGTPDSACGGLEGLRSAWSRYITVLRPDRPQPDWWAGAPSVALGPDGRVYLAARMREAVSPRGRRGYEVRLLASDDGLRFEPIASLKREQVPIAGFERPALLFDSARNRFRLYVCGPWPFEKERGWSVLRLEDVEHPGRFDAATARPVLVPEAAGGVVGYKDPFVWLDGGRYRMLVVGQEPERAYQFLSEDGDDWRPVGSGPCFDRRGWHSFYTRPSCVLPLGAGWLFVYEGSCPDWFDPAYNIATGLAWTPDFASWVDLTPEEPFLKSSTPGRYHTWRYSHWMWRGGELWAYAETACADDTNELRLFRIPLEWLAAPEHRK